MNKEKIERKRQSGGEGRGVGEKGSKSGFKDNRSDTQSGRRNWFLMICRSSIEAFVDMQQNIFFSLFLKLCHHHQITNHFYLFIYLFWISSGHDFVLIYVCFLTLLKVFRVCFGSSSDIVNMSTFSHLFNGMEAFSLIIHLIGFMLVYLAQFQTSVELVLCSQRVRNYQQLHLYIRLILVPC